jgi:hypothetical protein
VAVRFRLFDSSGDIAALRPRFVLGGVSGTATSGTVSPTALVAMHAARHTKSRSMTSK